MKKNKFSLISFAVVTALLFGACSTESYQHQVGIVYPTNGYVFADQTVDSVCFLTFDSYHYYPHSTNPDNFITVDEKNAQNKIMNQYYRGYYVTLPVYFTPNTTDKSRMGYVVVDSKSEMDDWSATAYAVYCQLNFHSITKPSPYYKYNSDYYIESCDYTMSDSAMQVTDTIKFYAYDKWSLASAQPDIINPKITEGQPGSYYIPCTVSQNSTLDTIRTTLLLQSENGAKTTINFKQAPKKKENN